LTVGFHGYLVVVVVMATTGVLCVPRVLGEDSEWLLQFDQFTVQDVMPHDQHRDPLVEGSRAACTRVVNVHVCVCVCVCV